MVVSEYAAFGPWIYEVNEEHPMPPLFVPYYKEDNNYLLQVKVPRDIERLKAKQDMDLYDFVIGMYEDHIYILKRNNKLVEEIRIFYTEIEGIEDLRELLKGTLTIYLKNNEIVIPYNTVSIDVIMKLTGIIRVRYTKRTFDEKIDYYFDKDLNVDTLYINLLSSLKSDGRVIRICAVQRSISLEFKEGSFLERIQHFLSGKILLNTLHLSNSKELIILTRGKVFNKNKLKNYSYAITYIPFEKLCSVIIENYMKYSGLVVLNLKLSEKEFKFYFEQINRESIDFYLNLNNTQVRDY